MANFGRKLEVYVTNRLTGLTAEYGSKDNAVNPLDIRFRFSRTGKIEEPDTAQITISNVDLTFYNSIEKAKNLFVEVRGGYADNVGLLFSGVVTDYTVGRVKNTTKLQLTLGDSIQDVVFRKAYTKETDYIQVFKDMANGMLDELVELPAQFANLVKSLADQAKTDKNIDVPKNQKSSKKKKGFTIAERLSKGLAGLLNPKGLEADIVNNELVIRKMFAESSTAVELSPSTGLMNVKRTFVTLKNAKGKKIEVGAVEFECKLIPNIYPSKTVEIESKTASGEYIVDENFTVTELKGSGGNRAGTEFKMIGLAHEKIG